LFPYLQAPAGSTSESNCVRPDKQCESNYYLDASSFSCLPCPLNSQVFFSLFLFFSPPSLLTFQDDYYFFDAVPFFCLGLCIQGCRYGAPPCPDTAAGWRIWLFNTNVKGTFFGMSESRLLTV
jgi:hypothetical protein